MRVASVPRFIVAFRGAFAQSKGDYQKIVSVYCWLTKYDFVPPHHFVLQISKAVNVTK